jgi:3-hydroxyacyl-CoA dehydrogenase
MTNATATIAVVGGGRMGIGIAQAFAAAGHYVVIAERDAPTASAALDSLRLGLRRAAERSELWTEMSRRSPGESARLTTSRRCRPIPTC